MSKNTIFLLQKNNCKAIFIFVQCSGLCNMFRFSCYSQLIISCIFIIIFIIVIITIVLINI